VSYRYLRPSEASAELDVHVSTIHSWARQGKIEALRVGGSWFFPRRAITAKQLQIAKERRQAAAMLKPSDVAAFFWVTVQCVNRWTKTGLLESVQVAGETLYPRKGIFEQLARQGYDLRRLHEERVNTATAAAMLKLSPGRTQVLIRNGTLPAAYTLSGHARILVSDIKALQRERDKKSR
jgi:excisionase family DNA binding protein